MALRWWPPTLLHVWTATTPLTWRASRPRPQRGAQVPSAPVRLRSALAGALQVSWQPGLHAVRLSSH